MGLVRNDLLVPTAMVGKVVGTGGAMCMELQAKTGAAIFIHTKDGRPPGVDPTMQPIVIIGAEAHVRHAMHEICNLVAPKPPKAKQGKAPKQAGQPQPKLPQDLLNSVLTVRVRRRIASHRIA